MQGIGFACASTFAAHGANVVVVDRDADAAKRSAHAIADVGGSALAVVADMLDENAVAAAVDVRTTSAPPSWAGW